MRTTSTRLYRLQVNYDDHQENQTIMIIDNRDPSVCSQNYLVVASAQGKWAGWFEIASFRVAAEDRQRVVEVEIIIIIIIKHQLITNNNNNIYRPRAPCDRQEKKLYKKKGVWKFDMYMRRVQRRRTCKHGIQRCKQGSGVLLDDDVPASNLCLPLRDLLLLCCNTRFFRVPLRFPPWPFPVIIASKLAVSVTRSK